VNEEPLPIRQLNPAVDEALETIALKCLEKAPDRRYGSAAALAEELERWLANEPILARPIGATERVLKWAQRRPAIAALAAGVVVVALLGVGGIVWQWREAVAARRDATDRAAAESVARAAAEASATAERDARAREAEQRTAAEVARGQAEEQRSVAQQALAVAEKNLYFNTLDLADRELQAGNTGQADALLTSAPASRRGWEWQYLTRLAHMEDWSLPLGAPASAVAVTPDGAQILTAGSDMAVRAWDAKTRRALGAVKLEGDFDGLIGAQLVFSADRLRVAGRLSRAKSGQTSTASLQLWDAATGRSIVMLPGSPQKIYLTFAVSPDSARFVAGAVDLNLNRGVISAPARGSASASQTVSTPFPLGVWDARSGQELPALSSFPKLASSLAFSSDGKRLAICGENELRIVDVSTGGVVASTVLPAVAGGLVFNHDGRALAGLVASATNVIKAWNTADLKELWSANAPVNVTSLVFSPDGQRLAVAMADRSVRVLDAATGQERDRLTGHTGTIVGLAFAPDGRHLLSDGTDGSLRMWTLPPADPPRVLGRDLAKAPTIVLVSPNRRAAFGTVGMVDLVSWDLDTGQTRFTTSTKAPAMYTQAFPPAMSADATRIVSPRALFLATAGTTASIQFESRIFDAATGRLLASLRPRDLPGTEMRDPETEMKNPSEVRMAQPGEVALSPRGDRAAQSVSQFKPTSFEPGRMAMVPDEGQVEVWDVASARSLAKIRLPDHQARSLQFSMDGRVLAFATRTLGGQDKQVAVHETGTGRLIQALPGADGPIAFGPGGRLASVMTGNTITIGNALDATRRLSLPQNNSAIAGLAFNPAGTRIVSLSTDGTVRVFDTTDGHQLLTLRESSGPFTRQEWLVAGQTTPPTTSGTIAFSDDGTKIVVTAFALDAKGLRIQIKTWDATPR
jgi:WD40 repeat protein